MDNLTHSLVGLVASKAGLERLSPGATAVCILAANAPDSDIMALIFGGRWAFLHHHRGITHSIVGTLGLALLLPLIFYLGDLVIARLRHRTRKIRFPGLLLASLVVSATHPLMDWTNNYGIRLLLPWNSRWFYGDFVFIVDPFVWLVLGSAAFLLTSETKKQLAVWLLLALIPTYLVLFGPSAGLTHKTLIRVLWVTALVTLAILSRRKIAKLLGRKVTIAAFAIVLFYYGSLALIHAVALRRAGIEAVGIANQHAEQVIKVAAMPTLANPFRWQCIMETERSAYRFELSLFAGSPGPSNLVRYEKIEALNSPALAQAERDSRVQIFLDFARFPIERVVGVDCATQTLVQFADLRYTEPGSARGTFALDVPVDCPLAVSEKLQP